MPEDFEPTSFDSVGYIGAGGMTWTPFGKVDEFTHVPSTYGTVMMVSRSDWIWLLNLLWPPRYDRVWAYRDWNKGHRRCR